MVEGDIAGTGCADIVRPEGVGPGLAGADVAGSTRRVGLGSGSLCDHSSRPIHIAFHKHRHSGAKVRLLCRKGRGQVDWHGVVEIILVAIIGSASVIAAEAVNEIPAYFPA